jgi:7,8-dihydropterin-6-yl-methyl-4-(beta-D-ribofuranosyl)aminobenzene 5'-phosphate synthase
MHATAVARTWAGAGLIVLAAMSASPVAIARLSAALAQEPGLRIIYLYDNTAAVPGVTADWGFACLVEGRGARVLFDTGTKPEVLTHNARVLQVDLGRLDAVVLSHDHGDHTAGFPALGPRPGLPVFYAQGFNPTVVAALRGSGAKLVPVSKSVQVLPGFRTSDEFGTTIREEALIVDARDGLVVIVGCSHPGIVTMLRQIKTSSGRPIHTIVGGFHLGQASADEVARIVADVRELGLVRVGATHCTGAEAIRVFKGAYGGHFIPGGVGTVVTARQ